MDKSNNNEYDMNIFTTNLKRYISTKQVQQKTVAEVVDVSTGTFSDWVKGRAFPRIDKLQALANYFGIRISDLIEKRNVIKERISDEHQILLDIYDDIPDEKRELAINILNTLKKEKISEEKQALYDLYEAIPDNKKDLAMKLLNTLKVE